MEIEQALYRIMQEALSNVARHSSAINVEVLLDYSARAVTLTIMDDGSGFDRHSHHDGMGLQSMCERAKALNGNCTIESQPGRGTRVSVSFPIS